MQCQPRRAQGRPPFPFGGAFVYISPRMKYSSRFFLYAPLGVFLVLFVVVGIHWWVKASAWSERLAAANGHEVVPGVTVTFEKRSIGGFPFSLDTQFQNVSFAVKTAQGITRWTTEKFASHALTYGRDETIFEAAGHQTLQWTGADGTPRTLAFAVGSLRASAIDTGGALSRFDFDLVGFGSKAFTAQRLQLHARRNGHNDIQLLATIDGLHTPPGSCALAAEKVVFNAAVSHADAFAPLLMGSRDATLAITDWRNAGGRVTSHSLDVTPRGDANRMLARDAALANLPAEEIAGIRSLVEAFCG